MKRTKKSVRGRRMKGALLLCASVALVLLGIGVIGIGIGISAHYEKHFPEELLVAGRSGLSPRFFAYRFEDRTNREGEREDVTATVYPQRARVYVTSDQIPAHLKAAFVAIEDQRFASHRGVDWYRTLAAGVNRMFGFSNRFGGSTITQQLVKNLTGRREVTTERKLQEILYARDLERRLSKEEILELYLNVIHFADRCDGIGAAAEHYFGKTVDSLTLAESVCLAAVINHPTRYHPIRAPERNRERRELILSVMLREGYLEQGEYRQALEEELIFSEDTYAEGINSWYADMAIEDVINDLVRVRGLSREEATSLVFFGGVEIDLAMDPEIQARVEAYYSGLSTLPRNREGEMAESALIVIDPTTGDVLGVAGAAGKKTANRLQNYATETLRPPGSAIKPITVYAPALSQGILHWASVYDDVPVNFGETGTRPWPRNANGSYRGLCNVAYAVAHSTNTVAVRILEEIGLDTSFAYAKERFHLSSLRRDREANDCDVAALAMGQLNHGVTLRELTAAYTVFADGGVYHPWRSYYRVTDAEGRVLLSSPDGGERVLSAENAAIMTKLLEGVIREGTSSSISLSSRTACAGKTGTTSHDQDRWFIGYTPELICGVWCGYAYPSPLSGRNLCTGIWNDVMQALTPHGGNTVFALPEGVFSARYCVDSGDLLTETCALDPRGERVGIGWFTADNAPRDACRRHVLCAYDREAEGLSHGACPDEHLDLVALVRVERRFPIRVRVQDAPYTVWESPGAIASNPDPNAPYHQTPTCWRGEGGEAPPFNRSCPRHPALPPGPSSEE